MTNLQPNEFTKIKEYQNDRKLSKLKEHMKTHTHLHESLSKLPNINEIYQAITSQKNNKAMGHDNIPAEIFKRRKTLMSHIIHSYIVKNPIDEQWKQGIQILIPKKK